jgi:hypothetical protein
MIYKLADGAEIDTARELNFEQRNFLQKMMIHHRLDASREVWRARWQGGGNPVWRGPGSLGDPSPAERILLDLDRRFQSGG